MKNTTSNCDRAVATVKAKPIAIDVTSRRTFTIPAGRPLRRETGVTWRGRALVVEIHAGFVEVREKGRREGVAVD